MDGVANENPSETVFSPSADSTDVNYDQSLFVDRLKYFAAISDMRKAFASKQDLDNAKHIVNMHSNGTLSPDVTKDEVRHAWYLYKSAFHPDSGEKMNIFGRMSFQVPGGMAITGLLLQFYKTPAQVAFMQWGNQSFNALVNYTNRNAASQVTTKQTLFAYVSATGTALAVALSLNAYSKKAPPVVARWVPFAAVAAANAVNIPLSRQSEVLNGVTVTTLDGKVLGKSKKCARKGISQVVLSRVVMAAPGMICLPIIMELLNKRAWFKRATWLHLPFQTLGVGAFLVVMVPTACALFPQRASMAVNKLEKELQESIRDQYGDSVKRVYFNKGL